MFCVDKQWQKHVQSRTCRATHMHLLNTSCGIRTGCMTLIESHA